MTKDKLTFDKYLVFDMKRVGDSCRIDTIRFLTDPDSAADSVLTPGADTTDPVIREIKREYAQLHAGHDKFRIVAKDIMDESTEGGDDTLYFEGAQLRRASVELMGETGKIKMDYYFAHGQLFFYISRETRKDLYPRRRKNCSSPARHFSVLSVHEASLSSYPPARRYLLQANIAQSAGRLDPSL